MRYYLLLLGLLTLVFFTPSVSLAEDDDDGFVDLIVHAEIGFVGALSHIIQFGEDGTEFDYVDEGGQDVLFFFGRVSADVVLGDRHIIGLLYQPLELQGRTTLTREHRIDGVVFAAGTPIDTVYSFPFWRLSYGYDLIEDPDDEVSIGLGLQIRDATIDFTSADGALRTSQRNVGPVPLLEFRGRQSFDNGVWWGAEVDGFYAPVSVLNGSDDEVTGAIADISVRVGLRLDDVGDAFFNVRYLGGGAVGSGDDGYTRNWLHLMTASLGFSAEIL